jgi:hypothetical protein
MVELISRVLLTFAVVLLAAACGDDSPTAPSQPNTPTVTDTFTGTLNPNGARTHSFVANWHGPWDVERLHLSARRHER